MVATTRTYQDACGVARALDVVGERWALVVVRELLLGPQRFSDLRRSLPLVSSNMLTDRLRELQGHGVLQRRTLPPPAGSVVYELTGLGRDLEPVLLALGAWGARFPRPPAPVRPTAASVLLALREAASPAPGGPSVTCRVDLDERVWTVRSHDGAVEVAEGAPAARDVHVRTDPATLDGLLQEPSTLDAAVAAGSAVVTGDAAALRRLLGSAAHRRSEGRDPQPERVMSARERP